MPSLIPMENKVINESVRELLAESGIPLPDGLRVEELVSPQNLRFAGIRVTIKKPTTGSVVRVVKG